MNCPMLIPTSCLKRCRRREGLISKILASSCNGKRGLMMRHIFLAEPASWRFLSREHQQGFWRYKAKSAQPACQLHILAKVSNWRSNTCFWDGQIIVRQNVRAEPDQKQHSHRPKRLRI